MAEWKVLEWGSVRKKTEGRARWGARRSGHKGTICRPALQDLMLDFVCCRALPRLRYRDTRHPRCPELDTELEGSGAHRLWTASNASCDHAFPWLKEDVYLEWLRCGIRDACIQNSGASSSSIISDGIQERLSELLSESRKNIT